MKKGFILVELLVALVVGTIVMGMIFSMYHFFNTVDEDGLDASHVNYSVNYVKELIIDNPNNVYSIDDDNNLVCNNEIIINGLAFEGKITYFDTYEDKEKTIPMFKKCLLQYDGQQIEFVVKELEQDGK